MEKNERVLTSSQARVLAVLEDAGRPMTLADLESETGLHPNTLRGHLRGLQLQGRLSRVAVRRPARGRPAWAYLAREPEYEALALALAEGVVGAPGQGPDEVAVSGGRAWGERLREQLGQDDAIEPRDRAMQALEHTGFAPTVEGDEIRLNACPLIDAARVHPGVVCGVHLGLVEAVTGRPGGVWLEPRPQTLGCRVSVR